MKKKPTILPCFIKSSLGSGSEERRVEIIEELIRRYLPGRHLHKSPGKKPKLREIAGFKDRIETGQSTESILYSKTGGLVK